MSYEVIVPRRVEKGISRIPESDYRRITRALHNLQEEPRPRGSARLRGSEFYRVRVGDYRIVYDIEEQPGRVTVTRIAHRREVTASRTTRSGCIRPFAGPSCNRRQVRTQAAPGESGRNLLNGNGRDSGRRLRKSIAPASFPRPVSCTSPVPSLPGSGG